MAMQDRVDEMVEKFDEIKKDDVTMLEEKGSVNATAQTCNQTAAHLKSSPVLAESNLLCPNLVINGSASSHENVGSCEPLSPASFKEFGTPISSSTPVLSITSVESGDESTEQITHPDRSESLNLNLTKTNFEVAGTGLDHEATKVAFDNQQRTSLMAAGSVKVPILGYEITEARSKFTVFKIRVEIEEEDAGWFIFRRYSDFVHLNDQLRMVFPNVRLMLPPKRWIRNNFAVDFLKQRQIGLQGFLDNIMLHRELCNSSPVRDFFCFDDPPGLYDSMEDSRAQCEFMEEKIYVLERDLVDREAELELAREELELYKSQVQLLTSRLSELNHYLSGDKVPEKCNIDTLFGDGGILIKEKWPLKHNKGDSAKPST